MHGGGRDEGEAVGVKCAVVSPWELWGQGDGRVQADADGKVGALVTEAACRAVLGCPWPGSRGQGVETDDGSSEPLDLQLRCPASRSAEAGSLLRKQFGNTKRGR